MVQGQPCPSRWEQLFGWGSLKEFLGLQPQSSPWSQSQQQDQELIFSLNLTWSSAPQYPAMFSACETPPQLLPEGFWQNNGPKCCCAAWCWT